MSNSKLIVGSKSGQLCNRLFTFSHLIVNAVKYGYQLYNPNFDEYCSYFQSNSKNDFGGYPISVEGSKFDFFRRSEPADDVPIWAKSLYISPFHKILATAEQYDLRSDTFTKILATNKTIITYGSLFTDDDGFKEYAALLKKFFEPVEQHSKRVTEVIESCRKRKNKLVGIHIRRGDYKSYAGGQFYYDDSVYLSKMQQIKELLNKQGQDVSFIVCSNEPNKDRFKGMGIVPSTGHFIEDLYSLAKCDYLMGSPSTYSMWASFYGNVPLLQIREATQKVCLSNFRVIYG
jgi:hypothetical protein